MKTAFHIEEKQSIRVVGYFLETTNQKGEARKAIPAFWSAIQKIIWIRIYLRWQRMIHKVFSVFIFIKVTLMILVNLPI